MSCCFQNYAADFKCRYVVRKLFSVSLNWRDIDTEIFARALLLLEVNTENVLFVLALFPSPSCKKGPVPSARYVFYNKTVIFVFFSVLFLMRL